MSWVYVTGRSGKDQGKGAQKGKGIPCPTELRAGDWNCSMCGQHNFAWRMECMNKACCFPAPVVAGHRGKSAGKGGKAVETKGKGKGKGGVPGAPPSATQSRNARKRAAKKIAKGSWEADGSSQTTANNTKELKDKNVEIQKLKKELADSKKAGGEAVAAAGSAPKAAAATSEEEQEAIPAYATATLKPLLRQLGLIVEDAKDTTRFLTSPTSKATGTAEETVAKLLKTDTVAAEAAKAAEYYKEKVADAEAVDSTVPKSVLESLKAKLAEAEKVTAKKSEVSQVMLDNMKAARSKLQATQTARLQKEAESRLKAGERATTRKEGLEAFSVAITVRIAEHLAVETSIAGQWELHYTALAARASEEMELVDKQITTLEEEIASKKDATMEPEPVTVPAPTEEEKKEEAGQSQFKDSDVLKEMQKQLQALQEQLDQTKAEAVTAVNEKAKELQALSSQRLQEIAFLRTVEDMGADTFKAASNSPSDEAKRAMIRTHQVLTEWEAGGAACMFTTKHLDVWAGLNGETHFLLEHLMGGKQQKKTWNAWFPTKPTDESIVPRQMARTLLQLLSKTKKVWEDNQEHSESVRQETDGLYTALSQEVKRRCLAVSFA